VQQKEIQMKILLLGATGFIGSAILPELCRAAHEVFALARSASAERRLAAQGAMAVRGDLRNPGAWSHWVREVDAVVHVAATFTDDMGEIDREAIQALISQARETMRRIRFVYTGGVWLYGKTGDCVVTETTPLDPMREFAWMERNSTLLLEAPCFATNIVHPGMCYERSGGVFSRFLPKDGQIEVWGSLDTRWPVVHRTDLAAAYRLVLECAPAGEAYYVCIEQGVRVGDVVNAMSATFEVTREPLIRSVEDVIADHGPWALGPTLDEQMSSRKIRESLGWCPVYTDAISQLASNN
jgi:nucleoside-diphosphate-sugar epimerase